MKKIFLMALVATSIYVSACKKSLTDVPKSFFSPENFFKTDQDAVFAVNGAYFWLIGQHPQRLFQQELVQYLDEDCDGIFFRGGKGDINQTPVAARYAETMWNGGYRGVQTTSQIIDKVGSNADTDIKKRVVGEARFLRALYYYYLTGIYKDVPLITEENYKDDKITANLSNTPADEVRDFIINDLNQAIAVLPASYAGTGDRGRATKGAAQTLLAKIYLWKKDWANALTTLQAIQGYQLLTNYADVFLETNEFNAEIIFEIDFQADKLNSYLHAFYSPSKTVGVEPFSNKTWYGSYTPLQKFVSSFETNDKRKNSIVALGYNGQNFKPDPANGEYVWFGPKWWRLSAGERNSGLDIYVFRYADVLLMTAEAANELSQTVVALEAINKVRTRAGLLPLASLSQDALRKAIQQERRIELIGEGHRKFDLVRWGIWYETAKAAMQDQAPIRAASYRPNFDYLPIPASQIARNPNLKQNPGY